MRILFLGDVVGKPGRRILTQALPALRQQFHLDLVIANAENAAGGSGLDARGFRQLLLAGVDACTLGDHCYKHKEVFALFANNEPVCRPANYPAVAPGPDHLIVETASGVRVGVCVLLGRLFMKPVDCPLRAADRVVEALAAHADVLLFDMHAEATSEKQVMLRHLIGRVSAVLGTHTHVPTADAAVYPPGTGFITDVGMTGPYDGVIGRRWDRVLTNSMTYAPAFFAVANGDPRISGAVVTIDENSGHATAIELMHLGNDQLAALGVSLAQAVASESTGLADD